MAPQHNPTREQITVARSWLYALATTVGEEARILAVDAALALFPQPTPTAEPMTLDQRAVQAFGPGVLDRTSPPHIEDMENGTTFTAFVRKRVNLVRRRGGVHYDGLIWPPDFVDPSTIRDVTPPPASA